MATPLSVSRVSGPTPHHTPGGFRNPWPSWTPKNETPLLKNLRWGVRHAPEPRVPLRVLSPDFRHGGERVRITWLGHASVLVQLYSPGESFAVLFDPIFSRRCSPSQKFGPARAYPAPCDVHALPRIDIVAVSHDHYDHMDENSLVAIAAQFPGARFCVPLGCKATLASFGISLERIVELDWWDHCDVVLAHGSVCLTCTPAQHASGRGGNVGRSLWSSWYLSQVTEARTVRLFFGGDTGLCTDDKDTSPECPAFAEIRERLGAPDVALLPVSVGATYGFLKSFDPLPDWLSPIPRATDGLARAVHMTPRDAVRTMRIMGAPVALAIHWGTFIEDHVEVKQTMARLSDVCAADGVHLVRAWDSSAPAPAPAHTFAMLDHGASLVVF